MRDDPHSHHKQGTLENFEEITFFVFVYLRFVKTGVCTFKYKISQSTFSLRRVLLLPVIDRILVAIEVIHMPRVVAGFRQVRGRNI